MHKLYIVTFVVTVFIAIAMSTMVAAVSQDIVISQVQVGNSSTSRLVELYNNSPEPVDITNWCVYHSSATDKTKDRLACFTSPNPQTHIILEGLSSVLLGSDELGIESDLAMSSGLGGVTGGHVYVEDADGVERDRVGWGTAEKPEGTAIGFETTNLQHVLERKVSDLGAYIDTDDNSLDFVGTFLRSVYKIGFLSEVDDVCANLDGIQPLLPEGYYRDEAGLCQLVPIDVCLNIDDIQGLVPEGYVVNDTGQCIKQDVCSNFDGIQVLVPDGFIAGGEDCTLAGLPLEISEILPNALGSDEGREFIEIYNPNDTVVDLAFFNIIVSTSQQKTYRFPLGSVILPHSYAVFYNNQILFTLANISGMVGVGVIGDAKSMTTDQYLEPQDDIAWAMIDGNWRYTNQPTPGGANLPSVVIVKPVPVSSLEPCASDQYRNPDTNRCRKKPTETTLAPCDNGEYRSPDTNRCRSVLGASTTSLSPCAENQVRNPETNRCKTVAKMVDVPYPVQTTQVDASNGYLGWWVAGGVGVLALGYGAWEWRDEVMRLLRLISGHLQFKK